MIEIVMHGAAVEVKSTPDGMKHMLVLDQQSGVMVRLSWDEEAAKDVAAKLSGSKVVVASVVPRAGPVRGI